MKEEKVFTVQFKRTEVEWLRRHLMNSNEKIEGLITKLNTPAGKTLTPEQHQELNDLVKHRDQVGKFIMHLGDCINHNDKGKLLIMEAQAELQEAIELCEEEEARNEARCQINNLPSEPPINISFDRHSLRFTLKLIEQDLIKFRASIIPNYEKSSESDYTDKIRTKSYYVNKARRSKNILEKLKLKMEKGL